MQAEQRWTGALVMQTIVAVVLAFVVYVIVSMLVGTALFAVNVLMTVLREGLISAMSGGIGAIIGVFAAAAACDAVLKAYSGSAVFVAFALAVGASAFANLVLASEWDGHTLVRAIVDTVTMVTAYHVFWKGER